MTARYSNFDTREIGKRLYQLLDDLVFYDDVLGPITAVKGFVTNYASIDGLKNIVLFPVYALLAGYGDKSATIHDFLYNRGGFINLNGVFVKVLRIEADRVLYRALRAEGVARWRASVFFIGVRLFGSKYYLPLNN